MNGVLYIAFGEKHILQASNSAKSLRRHSKVPIALFCNAKPDEGIFDQVRIIEAAHKRCKVDFIYESPFDNTVYLDSDTGVQRDISDVFELFTRFDVCGTHDHARKSSRWFTIEEYASIPYAFPEYNGGVLGFRKGERAAALFKLWRDKFYEYRERTNGQDQASLRIALWQSEARIATLPPEYNVRSEAARQKIIKRSRNGRDESLLKPRIYHWYGAETGQVSFFANKRKPSRI